MAVNQFVWAELPQKKHTVAMPSMCLPSVHSLGLLFIFSLISWFMYIVLLELLLFLNENIKIETMLIKKCLKKIVAWFLYNLISGFWCSFVHHNKFKIKCFMLLIVMDKLSFYLFLPNFISLIVMKTLETSVQIYWNLS